MSNEDSQRRTGSFFGDLLRAFTPVADIPVGAVAAFILEERGFEKAPKRMDYNRPMQIKVVVHEEEEGGYWAEVPAIPGCASQGDTMEELLANIREAIAACLSVDVEPPQEDERSETLVLAV